MSKFDELCKYYASWSDEAFNTQIAWGRFPLLLSEAVREYLGAPEKFVDAADRESTRRYVSMATAKWNENTQNFDLKITDEFVLSVDLHPDGRFYFALAVYLERARDTYPKHPFWFLLSLGYQNSSESNLKIQRTGQIFDLKQDRPRLEGDLEPICETIADLISGDLSQSPFALR